MAYSILHIALATMLSYFVLVDAATIQQTMAEAHPPKAKVQNGTYVGVHNDHYNIDYFLGIPFAQPPIGNLRLAPPVSLNSSFSGTRNATNLQPACVQFQLTAENKPQTATIDRAISEDCLTLNVYRPSKCGDQKLPLLVWIYGGGYTQGSNSDPRYNLTFIVNNSVKMGKPIIAVAINYRLNGFGFLGGPVIQEQGLTNLGLRDQRLALHWIQENTAGFGGDKSKVTIWGQSAGAGSVGSQLLAYGGRNDSLFRAAIADSGVNASRGTFMPITDGDFVETRSSAQLLNGLFVKVPLLTGTNTDEGTNFVGSPSHIGALPTIAYPNDTSFLDYIGQSITNTTASAAALAALSVLYPDIPAIGVPHSHKGRLNSTFGSQHARVATFAGDFMAHRGRRLSAQMWSKYNVPVYTYRFNQWPIGGLPDTTGTTHFTEIPLVQDHEVQDGYLAPWYPAGSEFTSMDSDFYALARLMSRMWIAFVHDVDPNGHGVNGNNGHSIPE
ncbi:extracellular carboxylesterase [Aspergillus flavus AF70]|nr:extracellular carboxylesterase [Aspergillus flavus AF70]